MYTIENLGISTILLMKSFGKRYFWRWEGKMRKEEPCGSEKDM